MKLNRIVKRLKQSVVHRYLHNESHLVRRYRPDIVGYFYDSISSDILATGSYELDTLESVVDYVEECLGKISLVIDIGANIGTTSLYLSSRVDTLIAFEAHPKTFRLLELNTEDIDNISAFNIALSHVSGQAEIYFDRAAGYMCSATLRQDLYRSASRESTKITTRRLDEIKSIDWNRRVLIKIDVEGHELEVLKGMGRILEEHRPVICFEVNKSEVHDGTSKTVEYLRARGYAFFNAERSRGLVNTLRIDGRHSMEMKEVTQLEKRYRLYSLLTAIPREAF